MKLICRVLIYLAALAVLGWEILALHYDFPWAWGDAAAAVLGLFSLSLLVFVRPRWAGIAAQFALFLVVLWWWLAIIPSNERNWAKDVALLPYAETSGDLVTLHNIRNVDYRSETDFDVRYYDRTFDLSRIDSIDLFVSFWGSPLIAHTILSFAFRDGQHIAFSVETRKRQGQDYSPIAGFFRQYELIYIAADEQDIIRLRTNYRGEEVYLYPLGTPTAKVREIFMHYIKKINQLREHPEFYNALADNCTTNIFVSFQIAPPYPPLSRGVILPGYLDRDIYEILKKRQGIDIPFEEFRRQSNITLAAQAADDNPRFSELIRAALPRVRQQREAASNASTIGGN